jgi:hypothetical protein
VYGVRVFVGLWKLDLMPLHVVLLRLTLLAIMFHFASRAFIVYLLSLSSFDIHIFQYREMSDDYVKGRWEDVETMELVSQIRCWLHHHTNGATSTLVDFGELAQLVEELKIQIPWSLISKRMGRRSRLSCFKKWQKLTGEAEVRAAFRAGNAVAAAVALEPSSPRPTKRQKTEEDEEEGAVPQEGEDEPAVGEQEDQEEVTEYIVPMTEAHNNMVVTADEAELAAETVEALGLPDLIGSKTTTTTSSTTHHSNQQHDIDSETTSTSKAASTK